MILRVILLLLLIFVIIVLIIKLSRGKNESFSNYLRCLQKGFTKTFCEKNKPTPGSCRCKNGNIGRIIPGFKGECICSSESILIPEKDVSEAIIPLEDSIPSYENPDSFLKNYEYKRSLFKGVEDIIPYSEFGNFSFF